MTQPVTPDLTNAGMDVTELAVGAKDVIASTAGAAPAPLA